MTTTTIETFDMALRAEHHTGEALDSHLFGHFQTKDFANNDVTLAFLASRYAYVGSPLCLELWTSDLERKSIWEPYADLTKNIRPNDCKSNEIIVKTYEENEHLRDTLLKAGFFEDTGKRIATGFVQLEIWRLTEKFVQAFNVAHPEFEST